MTGEQKQERISREAEKYIAGGRRGNWPASCVFNEMVAFYDHTILPNLLEEKNREIELYKGQVKNFADQVGILRTQLSQLQSQMEEEKRKAFIAAREISKVWYLAVAESFQQRQSFKYPTPEDYLDKPQVL